MSSLMVLVSLAGLFAPDGHVRLHDDLFNAPGWGWHHEAQARQPSDLTDDEIRKILIQRSIQAYPGPCPCPYSINRGGWRCDDWSAYIKPGGYEPLCYPSDVTPEMIRELRETGR